MALVVGVNSYDIVSNATLYFNDSLRKDQWAAFSSAVKANSMIEAWRYMQRLLWGGNKSGGASQVPAWPRSGLDDIDEATVPRLVIEAQYEIAIRLAANPTLIDSIADQTTSNVKRIKAGEVETEFFAPTTGAALFAWVRTSLGPILEGGSATTTVGRGGSVSGLPTDPTDAKYGKSKYGTTQF